MFGLRSTKRAVLEGRHRMLCLSPSARQPRSVFTWPRMTRLHCLIFFKCTRKGGRCDDGHLSCIFEHETDLILFCRISASASLGDMWLCEENSPCAHSSSNWGMIIP